MAAVPMKGADDLRAAFVAAGISGFFERVYMGGLVCVFETDEQAVLGKLFGEAAEIDGYKFATYEGLGAREAIREIERISQAKAPHADHKVYRAKWNAYDWMGDMGLLPMRWSPRANKAWETTVSWKGLVAAGKATRTVRVRYEHGGERLIETAPAANDRHAKTVANQLRRKIGEAAGLDQKVAGRLPADIFEIKAHLVVGGA